MGLGSLVPLILGGKAAKTADAPGGVGRDPLPPPSFCTRPLHEAFARAGGAGGPRCSRSLIGRR